MRKAPRSIALAFAASMTAFLGGTDAPLAQGFWSPAPYGGWSQPYYAGPRPAERVRKPEPRRERSAVVRTQTPVTRTDATGVAAAPGRDGGASALVAVVSIRDQSITVWGADGVRLRSRVSTGQSGYDTPTGLFSVIQKNRHHESNIYSGAPMPWMHRITWSGIALHAGVVPNHPASHGCIRLPYDVAPKLWAMSRLGMRVVVAPDDATLRMVEHDGLPQPRFVTAAELDDLVAEIRGEPRQASTGLLLASAPVEGRLVGPLEVAQRLKKETAAAVEVRRRAAREALAVAAEASATANAAADALREARAEVEAAGARARALGETLAAKAESDITPEERAALAASEAAVTDARARLALAVAADAEKRPPAFAAARAAREAEIAAEDAPDSARAASKRLEPVSVLVSAREQRVFVRQGFEPVLDSKVEIFDPIEPLGTHVFTAMAPAGSDRRLQWSVVTMPQAGQRGREDALAALERITMPDKVRDEIARRLTVGASLILTDEGISNETGKGTDFIVLTK